jgi:hypothetical protein
VHRLADKTATILSSEYDISGFHRESNLDQVSIDDFEELRSSRTALVTLQRSSSVRDALIQISTRGSVGIPTKKHPQVILIISLKRRTDRGRGSQKFWIILSK